MIKKCEQILNFMEKLSEEVVMEKMESDNPGVLVMAGEWNGWRFKMVSKYTDVQGEERNMKIKNMLEGDVWR